MAILYGDVGAAVYFEKIKKYEFNLRIILLILFVIYFSPAKAENAFKEVNSPLSEQQVLDIKSLGTELNALTPAINPRWNCQKDNVSKQSIDLEAMVERYSMPTTNKEKPTLSPQLFVFASNSMPETSLKQWSKQVERAGGVLVLRGFIDNSPQKTAERVRELFGKDETSGFSVDPERFKEMAIDKVPAVGVVLSNNEPCEGENCPKPMFEVVYGDIPLEDALLAIMKRNSRSIADAAKVFLERYRKEK